MSYRLNRPIPFGSRRIPYQFRAPLALRGLSGLVRCMEFPAPLVFDKGLGIIRRSRGLGLTCPAGQNMQGPNPEFPQGVCLEQCGLYTDVGSQYACEQRNTQAINAAGYEGPVNAPTGYTSVGNCAQYPNAPGCPGYATSQPAAPPPPSTPPPTTYTPRLSFNTSRGGSTVYPGDTWTITITGAAPNQPVSVLGIHPDGGSATQGYGNTDGSGNFKLAGQITSDMVGNWQETWTVGGQQAGSFSFTVAALQQAARAASVVPSPPSPAPAGATGAYTTLVPSSVSSFSFGSIPWWGWGIAAVGGFMLLGGGGKR